MAERMPFLNKPYSAYYHRGMPPDDEELTRVGPGTPCGEYMRRFWQPVILANEVGDLPVKLRILGEDLVIFRDGSGEIGLLELHCPHRGTSLEFGLVGEKGIRCCYHGWLFGCDGTILETPGEPADSTLKEKLFHGSYPVHEHAGLLFAYMGKPEEQPPFPMLDTYDIPGYRLVARKPTLWECNWLQVKENSMDPAHLAFLHTLPGSEGFTEDLKELGEWDWMETPLGMVYIDTRRQDDRVWVRVADFILPNIHQFPPNQDPMALRNSINRPQATTWAVPLDDTHTMQIGYYRAPEGKEPRRGSGFGQDNSRSYEERQRVPGDYDAQVSIHNGMARHGLEHLASTDRGIIMMRNMIRAGIRANRKGGVLDSPMLKNGAAVPTYSHDRVVPGIAPAVSAQADRQLLRDVARDVVATSIREGGLSG
ncbi:MAG TPA: aromatic ring-hydroxylating dioxygenase subunit alpha [Stellaceae bacterium]|jgi:phenylpropionate dioxygenase-like ring-hydroxylating dioxygenase large terminal subunit|nr:aromatic ring-hydroxylating dioxygenase subunit alpha [Stellaceae bacterium]